MLKCRHFIIFNHAMGYISPLLQDKFYFMRFFRYFFILSLFLSIFYLPVSAQNNSDVLNQILDKSAKSYTYLPIEKVYIHFDKPYYAVGDTIWFKAYLTSGIHQPSLLSNIIYIYLLAPRDSVVRSLKLQVKNGVAWGSIPLSQTLRKGNYRLVAYTNYMNNLGVA